MIGLEHKEAAEHNDGCCRADQDRDEQDRQFVESAIHAEQYSKKPPSLSPAALRTAQKEAPATLEGAHGAEGLLWAEHVRTLDYALDTSAAALARALTSASRKMVLRARFQILLLHPSVNLKRRASLVSLTTGLVTTQR
jgi:hypothetical protein